MRTTNSDDRLVDWNQLRVDNQNLELGEALVNINNWWQMLPLDNFYLHWDDIDRWPSPWEIIADGIFCNLTKALGIAYTIHLLERDDIQSIELAQTKESDNLVLVNQGLYILNWSPNELLNIQTSQLQIERLVHASVVTKKIN